MDDLEKAIIFMYEPGTADPGLRAQAMAFCEQAKADPSALLRLCLNCLHRSSLVLVQFWCLQALHDAIFLRYPSLPSANLPLHSSLLSLASDCPFPPSPPFLRNKLAQALAALIRLEYPTLWPSVFLHLLPCLPFADSLAVDMFTHLLAALDDDLLSQNYPYSPDKAATASRIKDALCIQCVPQITIHWFKVMSLYYSFDPTFAVAVLDTMRRYIP